MQRKSNRTAQKPNDNASNRIVQLGVMQSARKREEEPSYIRLLHRFRLIDREQYTGLQRAFSVWQDVCRDAEVIRLSMALAAKGKPLYLASVTEPFKNGARVLAAMSDKQLSELKGRIGLGKEKPCR
jgi:hypothetical protein